MSLSDNDVAEQAEKLLGRPFILGDPDTGVDCLSLLHSFYGQFGVEFPEEIDGINWQNYPEIWTNDNNKARRVFDQFLNTLGDPVPHNFHIRGDLLLLRGEEFSVFPAICLGNGNILIVIDGREKRKDGSEKKVGGHVVPFKAFEKYFIGARRLVK